MYGTTSANKGFQYYQSKNLKDWKKKGFAFKKTENTWGQKSFWAPEVIYYQDKFYMIYSSHGPTKFGSGLRLCLAVADKPSGPFTDLYAPLFDHGFSCIDGHIFLEEGKKPILYYEMVGAVGEFWKQQGFLWGAIFGVELSEDLSKPTHEPVLCLYPSQEWEGLNSTKARSNEGMTVFKTNETYYMTYSGNHYVDPNYGVGYATAETPLGRWTKAPENPILKNNLEIGVSGPGHNGVFQLSDPDTFLIFYHTHADSKNPSAKRVLNMDKLVIEPNGTLKIDGPSRDLKNINLKNND